MNNPLKIVVLGAGNVSHHLLQAFSLIENCELLQIYNHQKSIAAKQLAKLYHCNLVSDIQQLNITADIYFICVKDDAIEEVAKKLSGLNLKGLVVHTSGSIDVSALHKASANIGVYYPLQSFSKNESVNWATTPLLIEANNKSSLNVLKTLAKKSSTIVKVVDSQKRLQFHLSAVFACNFTNALYAVAFNLIENSLTKKDTKLLEPLMSQSFNKMLKVSPLLAQTGPAKRNDTITMTKHLKLLQHKPTLKKLYKQLSGLIIEQQKNN